MTTFKHFKKTLWALLPLGLALSACESFLDQQPVSQLSTDQFWESRDDIIAGTAGMYDGLQSVVSNRYIDWGEGRSDNLTNGGTGVTSINFALNGLTSNMSETSWDALYSTIGRANLIIQNVPGITKNITVAEKNNFLAQAYAMRAYCHFTGMKVWGDVPLILAPVTDRTYQPVRTPANQVLTQVVADLNQALTLVDPANTDVYSLNVGAIQSILMDAYMWQRDYQNALTISDKLIALKRYSLVTLPLDWNTIFTNPATSKEAIWSLSWVLAQDGANGYAGKLGSSSNTSPYIMDPAVLSRWETQKRDFRRYLTYDTVEAKTGSVQDIYKYYPVVGGKQALPTTSTCEVRNSMYRYADILLMRAEAYNQLNNKTAAVPLLNQVKARAGAPQVSATAFTTVSALETAILNERQLELFGEGKRWFDLRRTGHVIDVMDPVIRQRQTSRNLVVTGFGDPGRILFPLNTNNLNANPNLIQNSPYTR
ncbi:RagB/SusD family nutrient uptake outer membrane protein [Hymenobacter terrigena]